MHRIVKRNSKRLSRILVFAAVLAAAFAVPAYAQQFPRAELFGGFSYANLNLGRQANLFAPTSRNYRGFGFSLGINLNRHLGLLADFGFQFGKSVGTPAVLALDPSFPFSKVAPAQLQPGQVLFEPRFAWRRKRSTEFAHALAGIDRTDLSLTTPTLAHKTNLALGFGGGMDINLTRHLAIRAVQADYMPERRDGQWTSGIRLSMGLVGR